MDYFTREGSQRTLPLPVVFSSNSESKHVISFFLRVQVLLQQPSFSQANEYM